MANPSSPAIPTVYSPRGIWGALTGFAERRSRCWSTDNATTSQDGHRGPARQVDLIRVHNSKNGGAKNVVPSRTAPTFRRSHDQFDNSADKELT
jgi:hypothetical protein